MLITVGIVAWMLCQTSPPAGVTQATPVALAEPYFDGSYGFSIRPPANWTVQRRREVSNLATTLLRMEEPSPSEPRAFVVEHMVTARAMSIDERFRLAVATFTVEQPEHRIDVKEAREIDGRPGGLLEVSFELGKYARHRMHAFVEIAPRNYLILRYEGDAESRRQIAPVFHAVLDSIKLLAGPLTDEDLKAALESGATWMESLDKEALRKAITPEQYFVFEAEGRPIGFVEIYQRERALKMRERRIDGVEIFEQSWMFSDDGAVRRNQNKLYLSHDLQLEKWQASATTWLKPEGDRLEQFENAYEEGLRDNDVLISSQTPSFSFPLQQNPPMRLPRTYIPRVMVRLLPRLVGRLDEPRNVAFVTFDHERSGLIIRVIELKGKSADERVGGEGAVYRLDDREGVAAEPMTVLVNEKGALRLVKTRAYTMRVATLEELKRLFEARVLEAEEAMIRMEQAYSESQSRFIRRR